MMVPIPANAQSAPLAGQAERSFRIPAQPLETALAQFSRESGVDLLFDHGLASGRRSAAIAGSYSVQRALHDLLAGTGLVARFTGPAAAVILTAASGTERAVPAPQPQQDNAALQLDTIRVRATPLLGGPPVQGFATYGLNAQNRIQLRLRESGLPDDQEFRIVFRAYLKSSGAIDTIDLIRSTGDSQLDQRIRKALLANPFLPPPPPGLPEPLKFEIVARGARN